MLQRGSTKRSTLKEWRGMYGDTSGQSYEVGLIGQADQFKSYSEFYKRLIKPKRARLRSLYHKMNAVPHKQENFGCIDLRYLQH